VARVICFSAALSFFGFPKAGAEFYPKIRHIRDFSGW
jgi:hypothetical protein